MPDGRRPSGSDQKDGGDDHKKGVDNHGMPRTMNQLDGMTIAHRQIKASGNPC